MASEAARHPGRMAGLTRYLGVGMCQSRAGNLHPTPASSVLLDGVRVAREVEGALVLLGMRVINIGELHHLHPLRLSLDGQLLFEGALLKAALMIARQVERSSRGVAGSFEGRLLVEGAVAILASNRDGIANFAVEFAVAVRIGLEMTVGALHAHLGVDILQLDGATPFVRRV